MMEIEAKFRIPNPDTYLILQSIRRIERFAIQEGVTQIVQDTYWDTPDRRIMGAGYACRIRQIGEEYTVTLKSLGAAQSATHRREELETPIPNPLLPQQWPASPVQAQVLSFIQDAPWQELLRLRQIRQKRSVQQGKRRVAEFSLDTVEQAHGKHTQSYMELEIELQPDGSEADLAAMVTFLQDTYHLEPQLSSKFERGLHFAGIGVTNTPGSKATIGIRPDDTMTEAARKTLRFHFQCMVAQEAATRLGTNIEALHDMRVATRRMRAAFRIYRDYLDMEDLSPHLKRLKRTAHILGAVRDLDVYHEKLTAYVEAQPPDSRPDLTPLWQAWEQAHQRARAALEVYLEGAAYTKFKTALEELLEHPLKEPWQFHSTTQIAPHRLSHVAPEIIYRRLGEVRAYDEWLRGPDVPLARYHQLRIAIKYLRYTLEFFQGIVGPEIAAPIEQLKSLQDYLGDLQDAVIACNRLNHLWRGGTLAPPPTPRAPVNSPPLVAPDVARYHASRQQEIQEKVAAFPTLWGQFQTSDFFRQIAKAISIL